MDETAKGSMLESSEEVLSALLRAVPAFKALHFFAGQNDRRVADVAVAIWQDFVVDIQAQVGRLESEFRVHREEFRLHVAAWTARSAESMDFTESPEERALLARAVINAADPRWHGDAERAFLMSEFLALRAQQRALFAWVQGGVVDVGEERLVTGPDAIFRKTIVEADTEGLVYHPGDDVVVAMLIQAVADSTPRYFKPRSRSDQARGFVRASHICYLNGLGRALRDFVQRDPFDVGSAPET